MKKLIISLALVLVLILAVAAPAFAASQMWYLYNASITDQWGHSEKVMSQTIGQTGHVDVPAKGSMMWIANKIALAKVTYPNDVWVARIATDSDWNGGCVPEVGYWDGTKFTALAGVPDVKYYASNFEVLLKFVPMGGQTIPANTYLAVTVYNLSDSSHPVYTGEKHNFGVVNLTPGTNNNDDGSWYYSCLATPQSDPGYPLPELAAGVLLGAGILGLGSFMIIRRKQSDVKI